MQDYYWLINVFSFASFQDLHTCYHVCKTWRDAASFEGLPQYHGKEPIKASDLTRVSHVFLNRLTSLSLVHNTDDDWFLFCALPYLQHLSTLDMRGAKVKDKFIKQLLNPSNLPSLTTLDVSTCKLLSDFRPIQQLAQVRQTVVKLGNNHFRSRYASANSTHITFINNSPVRAFVWWLDLSGKTVEYSRLQPGTWLTQGTYESHPWVVTTENDVCLMRTVATKKPQVVSIGDVYPDSLIPIPQTLATIGKELDVTIVVHNKANVTLFLDSIGTDGKEEGIGISVPHGSRLDLRTFETVPWIISDAQGRSEPITFIATKQSHHVIIRVDANQLTYTKSGYVY